MADDDNKAPPLFDRIEKLLVYGICIGVLSAAGAALHRSGSRAQATYAQVVAVLKDARADEHTMTTTVALLGMRDMAVLRSAVLFIGFIVVLMGCVFVLKGVEAMYKLRIQAGENRATLATASPGLVLITAGMILVLFALRQESSVSFKLEGGAAPAPIDAGPEDDLVRNHGESPEIVAIDAGVDGAP